VNGVNLFFKTTKSGLSTIDNLVEGKKPKKEKGFLNMTGALGNSNI